MWGGLEPIGGLPLTHRVTVSTTKLELDVVRAMPAGELGVNGQPDVGGGLRDGDMADRAVQHELARAWGVPEFTARDEPLGLRD